MIYNSSNKSEVFNAATLFIELIEFDKDESLLQDLFDISIIAEELLIEDGINYSIRALPLGGFVQMAGEIYEDDDTNKIPKDQFMCNRPWYQRLIILVAGVFNNFLLAIILLFVIALIWGAPSLDPIINDVINIATTNRTGIDIFTSS